MRGGNFENPDFFNCKKPRKMTNFPDAFCVKNLSPEGKRQGLKKLIFLEVLFQKMVKFKFRKTAKTYHRSESHGFSEPDLIGTFSENFKNFSFAAVKNI